MMACVRIFKKKKKTGIETVFCVYRHQGSKLRLLVHFGKKLKQTKRKEMRKGKQ